MKKKTFDCVEMQHEGGKRVQEMLEGMTLEEQLALYNQRRSHKELRQMGQLMDYERHIARDPKICGGQPVIRGTRVTLRTVLASLAEGATVEEILTDFPTITEEDVRAIIAFAAISTEEDLPTPSSPGAHAHQD